MTLMEPARVELSRDVTSRPDQMINDDSKSKLRPMKKTHSAWRIKLGNVERRHRIPDRAIDINK